MKVEIFLRIFFRHILTWLAGEMFGIFMLNQIKGQDHPEKVFTLTRQTSLNTTIF